MPRFLCALAAAAALTSQAFAQTAPELEPRPAAAQAPANEGGEAPTLESLITEALERSPAIAAARADVAARREMESPAGALPDPMVEAMLQNLGFSPSVGEEEMSMLGVQARQGLPYPGKRAAAHAMAAAETARAMTALTALERQATAEISTLYARLYALDRERETLAAAAELVDLLEETARSRYSTGEGDLEGVLKAQVQELRVAEAIGDLTKERRTMVAEINRWLDRPGDARLGPVRDLPAAPAIGSDAQRLAVAASAEVQRATAAVVVAERRVEVARLELKPSFSVGAGLASRGDLDPVVLANVGVELPFWRRQKQLPMLRAAEHELEAARRELADVAAMTRAEAERLLAEWTNADEQVHRYREGILPQTSAALDAARTSYLIGRGDFSTVIEDFNLWLESRVALARREADRFAARAGFDRLIGPRPVAAGSEE
jgi:outer membrane protein TolC